MTFKLQTEPIENRQVKVTAEIEKELMEQYKKQAARQISKQNKIPGFRPGKAPFAIVQRHFGDEAIEKHAIEIMLDKIYPQIVEESGLEPSGAGHLEDVVDEDPPKFVFIIPLLPEVKLGDYKSIKKEYELPQVTEKDVNDLLENVQRSYGVAEPVDRAAKKDDVVSVKFFGELTNPEEDEEPVVFKEVTRQIQIGQEPETWPFKGFSEQLIGVKKDDKKEITHTFPEDAVVEKSRGKEIRFTVEVENVKEMNLPELDDDFAKSLGEYESMEDLRSSVEEQLKTSREHEYDENFVSETINEILEMSTVEYPPHILENEQKYVINSIQQDLSRQNLDIQTYLKIKNLNQQDFLDQEVIPVATKRIERSLILDEIAKDQEIELDESDLQENITRTIAEIFNMPGFKQPDNKEDMKRFTDMVSYDTANRLLNEKIINRLKFLVAGIEEVKASESEESEETVEEAVEEKPEEDISTETAVETEDTENKDSEDESEKEEEE